MRVRVLRMRVRVLCVCACTNKINVQRVAYITILFLSILFFIYYVLKVKIIIYFRKNYYSIER